MTARAIRGELDGVLAEMISSLFHLKDASALQQLRPPFVALHKAKQANDADGINSAYASILTSVAGLPSAWDCLENLSDAAGIDKCEEQSKRAKELAALREGFMRGDEILAKCVGPNSDGAVVDVTNRARSYFRAGFCEQMRDNEAGARRHLDAIHDVIVDRAPLVEHRIYMLHCVAKALIEIRQTRLVERSWLAAKQACEAMGPSTEKLRWFERILDSCPSPALNRALRLEAAELATMQYLKTGNMNYSKFRELFSKGLL